MPGVDSKTGIAASYCAMWRLRPTWETAGDPGGPPSVSPDRVGYGLRADVLRGPGTHRGGPRRRLQQGGRRTAAARRLPATGPGYAPASRGLRPRGRDVDRLPRAHGRPGAAARPGRVRRL